MSRAFSPLNSSVMSQLYQDHHTQIRTLLSQLISSQPTYQNLEWRLDVQVRGVLVVGGLMFVLHIQTRSNRFRGSEPAPFGPNFYFRLLFPAGESFAPSAGRSHGNHPAAPDLGQRQQQQSSAGGPQNPPASHLQPGSCAGCSEDQPHPADPAEHQVAQRGSPI